MPLKLPTWEAAKEIAKKLPGDDEGDGEVCEECGKPYGEDEEKPTKKMGKL
jgi:hypothetical protein